MTRGGAWACPRSVRMLVSRRPLRSEYTNSRSVSFTVTLRKGSSKATDGSGLAFTTHRHCTVSRAAAQWDSKRITGATAGARQDPVGWRWGLGAFWAEMSCPCLCTLSCMCSLSHFSCIRLFATPWTEACQAPLSMGFSRQESWSG